MTGPTAFKLTLNVDRDESEAVSSSDGVSNAGPADTGRASVSYTR